LLPSISYLPPDEDTGLTELITFPLGSTTHKSRSLQLFQTRVAEITPPHESTEGEASTLAAMASAVTT